MHLDRSSVALPVGRSLVWLPFGCCLKFKRQLDPVRSSRKKTGRDFAWLPPWRRAPLLEDWGIMRSKWVKCCSPLRQQCYWLRQVGPRNFRDPDGCCYDATGAVVPQAKITLRNAASGDTRNTVADQQGYYTFASVPVGTYNLTVAQAGFQTFEEDGIALGGGENTKCERAAPGGEHESDGAGFRSGGYSHACRFGRTDRRSPPKNCRTTFRWAATRPSTSRSCQVSASRTARRT